MPSPPLLYVFAFSISGFIFLWQDGVFAVIEFAAPSLKPGGGKSRRSPFLVLDTTAELLPSSDESIQYSPPVKRRLSR